MGNRGRYGKYGEAKRRERLRQSRRLPVRPPRPPDEGPARKGARTGRASRAALGPGSVALRHGLPPDRAFIESLARMVFSEYGDYDRILPMCVSDPRIRTLIAECHGRPVGFGMLSVGPGIGEVVAIAVDPFWQGLGLGERLMTGIIREAERVGLSRLVLRTAAKNQRAQGLFRKVGFEKTDSREGYYAGGQSAIGMLKWL